MTRAWRFVREHEILLPLGAVVAIVWANGAPDSYFRMAQGLAFVVNDVGMAFVLAYLMQEIMEAALPGGLLHPWRRTLLPVVAGIGGTVGAIAVYGTCIQAGDEEVLAQGWPAACAVDLLLCLAIVKVIFRGGVAVTFALLVAMASDAVGLMMISRQRLIVAVHPAAALLIAAALGVSVALSRSGRRSVWGYLCVPAPLAWLGCYWAGVHPALALLPIMPFLPRSARDVTGIARPRAGTHRRASHFESVLEYPVQLVAFLFGLVNAGVLLRGFGTGTWAILTASLVGRPAGTLAAAAIALGAGLQWPRHVGWKELAAITLATTPGLAFGLFFASAVFPDGPLLIETRMGALSTTIGVLLAFGAARLLRLGRFAIVASPRQPIRTRATGGAA